MICLENHGLSQDETRKTVDWFFCSVVIYANLVDNGEQSQIEMRPGSGWKRIMKKYSEDYALEEVTDKNGKTKEVAVYRGDYFEVSLDEQGVPRFKKICLAIIALIAFWHIGSGFVGNPGMYQFYVALPYVLAFFPMVYLAAGIINLPREKRKYRRDEIGLSYDRIKTTSIILLVALGAGVVGEIAYILFGSVDKANVLELFYLSLEMMAAAGDFILMNIQRKVSVSSTKK